MTSSSSADFRISYADNPAITDLVTRPDDKGLRQADLYVFDMRCASCGNSIEAALRALPGVEKVQINAARHHVHVNYDESQTTFGRIMDAIEDVGYTPTYSAVGSDDPRVLKEKRSQLKRIGVAGIAMMQVMMFAIALYAGDFQGMEDKYRDFLRWVSLLFCTPVVFYSAQPFFQSAYRSLRHQFARSRTHQNTGLVMDIPVSLAIASAYSVSVYATATGQGDVYFDSVTMFTFFLLSARYLDQRLRHKLSGQSELTDLFPDQAFKLSSSGEEQVNVDTLKPGDLIRLHVGGMIPTDGVVLRGNTEVDESSLTGESRLVQKQAGSRVYAGTLNVSQPVKVEVTAVSVESRMADIARLAERATLERPGIVSFTDVIARYFVAFVLVLAATAFITWSFIEPEKALWVTLAVLVVSCPCALSLATPAAATAATMALKRVGFVCTRGYVLERLGSATDVVFDKTGTLTGGNPEITDIETLGNLTAEQAKSVACQLEQHANHPIAQAFDGATSTTQVEVAGDVTLFPSQGIEGNISGHTWRIGSAAFCGIEQEDSSQGHSRVYLSRDNRPAAVFHLRDGLRGDAVPTLQALSKLGLTIRIYSGDDVQTCNKLKAILSPTLGQIDIVGALSPEQKLERIKALQNDGHEVIMVGDGINDVPGLSAASLSITPMGASDLARTKSDALILSKGLLPLVHAIQRARKTQRVITENLSWALAYNLIAIPMAAAGLIQPWVAALGMSASSLIVTLNSIRLSSRSVVSIAQQAD